jgi:hypothetical protein
VDPGQSIKAFVRQSLLQPVRHCGPGFVTVLFLHLILLVFGLHVIFRRNVSLVNPFSL